jgi:hypothetical protein
MQQLKFPAVATHMVLAALGETGKTIYFSSSFLLFNCGVRERKRV